MVRFQGIRPGSYFWVSDERVEEYKELGYSPAPEIAEPAITPTKKEVKKPATKRTTKTPKKKLLNVFFIFVSFF